jgi:transposase
LIEQQAELGNIDLYYADETQFSQQGYVPYGWQFDDEDVAIEACKGKSMNCFGLLSRTNQFIYKMTEQNINSDFVIEILDNLSLRITKFTFVVLDNARIHTARKVKQLFEVWQQRGLFIFYLPPYSPHLNIIERLWKEMKQGWLKPSDYRSADDLKGSNLVNLAIYLPKGIYLSFIMLK